MLTSGARYRPRGQPLPSSLGNPTRIVRDKRWRGWRGAIVEQFGVAIALEKGIDSSLEIERDILVRGRQRHGDRPQWFAQREGPDFQFARTTPLEQRIVRAQVARFRGAFTGAVLAATWPGEQGLAEPIGFDELWVSGRVGRRR